MLFCVSLQPCHRIFPSDRCCSGINSKQLGDGQEWHGFTAVEPLPNHPPRRLWSLTLNPAVHESARFFLFLKFPVLYFSPPWLLFVSFWCNIRLMDTKEKWGIIMLCGSLTQIWHHKGWTVALRIERGETIWAAVFSSLCGPSEGENSSCCHGPSIGCRLSACVI